MRDELRSFWTEKWFRWPLLLLMGSASIVAITQALIHYRAEIEWAQAEARLNAEGETIDYSKLVPPPVPDDQNFCATPALLNIADGKLGVSARAALDALDVEKLLGIIVPPINGLATCGSNLRQRAWVDVERHDAAWNAPLVLEKLRPQETLVAELAGALERRYSNLTPSQDPTNRRTPTSDEGMAHVASTLNLVRMMRYRAAAALEVDDLPQALLCARISLRTIEASSQIPNRVANLASCVTFVGTADLIWGLCELPTKDPATYDKLMLDLKRIDFLTAARNACKGELALTTSTLLSLSDDSSGQVIDRFSQFAVTRYSFLRLLPKEVFAINAAASVNCYLDYYILPLRTGSLIEFAKQRHALSLMIDSLGESRAQIPFRGFACSFHQTGARDPWLSIHAEMLRRFAIVACALERENTLRHEYPETLGVLRLAELDDLWSEKPIMYAKTPNDRYKLWSVGPDRIDDGGTRVLDSSNPTSTPFKDPSYKGDWVWDYPVTAAK